MLTKQEIIQSIRDTLKLRDDLQHLANENVASPEQLVELDKVQNLLAEYHARYPFWFHQVSGEQRL